MFEGHQCVCSGSLSFGMPIRPCREDGVTSRVSSGPCPMLFLFLRHLCVDDMLVQLNDRDGGCVFGSVS